MNAAAQNAPVEAAFLIIGNEILSGRTQDRNLSYLALALGKIGVQLAEVRVVRDIEADIADAVNALRARYRYVVTSGGIGPTHDDITTRCIARAFGLPVVQHPEAVALLKDHYKTDPKGLNAARMKMTEVPEGAELIPNPVSRAPGYRIGNVHVLAGVPAIFRALTDHMLTLLEGGNVMHSAEVVCNAREGDAAEGLSALQDAHPDLDFGSYPYFRGGKFGVSLVVRGTDADAVASARQALEVLVKSLGADLLDARPAAETSA